MEQNNEIVTVMPDDVGLYDYYDLWNDNMPWADVLYVAKQMLRFELPLVRKAVLLAYTGQARDPCAYLTTLACDWTARGITTYQEFCDGKGLV